MKFYCISFCSALCLFVVLVIYSILKDMKNTKVIQQAIFLHSTTTMKTYTGKDLEMKYILLWTSGSNSPFVFMGEGQKCFLERNCMYINCYVTVNKKLLGSPSKFDVVMFAGPELDKMETFGYFPDKRSTHQKYVFANIESAAVYDVQTDRFDNYFNWTWTYKLNSDLRWGYIIVRDLNNNIIGPKTDMNWLKLEDMDPVTDEFKLKLKSKKRAAAVFVSNCNSESRREIFVRSLRNELLKYRQIVDVYGDCGVHVCTRDNERACDDKIAKYYYFYLCFENSFSEDYVTEKLLRALKNDAVPVVYGGANYTRFMPDGIYLNALKLGVKKLAAKMNELIKNPEKYANYFRWKNHYKYERTTDNPDTDEYCTMCAILNDQKAVNKTSIYKDFRKWWNPKDTDADFFENEVVSALLK